MTSADADVVRALDRWVGVDEQQVTPSIRRRVSGPNCRIDPLAAPAAGFSAKIGSQGSSGQVMLVIVQGGHWAADGGRLTFLAADGGRHVFTSPQIFRVLFRGEETITGVAVHDPRLDLAGLDFSPVPAEVVLRLSVHDGHAWCSASLEAGGELHPIAEAVDQVVLEGTWYPVVIDDLERVLHWFDEEPARRGPLSAGDVIRLRFDDTLPCRLVDDFSITAESIAVEGVDHEHRAELEATLYPYQEFGLAYLVAMADQDLGCILGDEMGLGKTLQVIGLLENQRARGLGPALVLAPATVLENWRREIRRFAPRLSILPHRGPDRAGDADVLRLADVVIASYETAVRDQRLLSQLQWNVLVLDEAQAIKSPTAQRTLVAKGLPRRVSVAVTGTPVENRLEDLWSLSDFAISGLLGTFREFTDRFPPTTGAAEDLAPVVAPIVLRRRVADVASDLPELIETPQWLSSDPVFAAEYEDVRQSAQGNRAVQLGVLQRLRMLAAGAVTAPDGSSRVVEKDLRLMELLEEMADAGQKALIFCSFTDAIDRLRTVVEACGFIRETKVIDGRTPVLERQGLIDDFGEALGAAVLILNPRAAGTGLNITAANHVVHFNPEWNPAITDQASRRAFRRGQSLPVTVHHLIYEGTVEEAIWSRSQGKRELAEAALTDTDPELSPSDLSWALDFTPMFRSGEG